MKKHYLLVLLCSCILYANDTAEKKTTDGKSQDQKEFNSKFEDITSKKLDSLIEKVDKVDANINNQTQQNKKGAVGSKEEKATPVYLGGYTIEYNGKQTQKVYLKDGENHSMVKQGKGSVVKKVNNGSVTLDNDKIIPLYLNKDAKEPKAITSNKKRSVTPNFRSTKKKDDSINIRPRDLPSFDEVVEQAKKQL